MFEVAQRPLKLLLTLGTRNYIDPTSSPPRRLVALVLAQLLVLRLNSSVDDVFERITAENTQ
jgi:hypothetical protein